MCGCIFDQQKAVVSLSKYKRFFSFLFDTYSMSHCILWISLRIWFNFVLFSRFAFRFASFYFDFIQCLLYLFLRVLMPLVVYHLLCAYLKAVWSFIGTRIIPFFSSAVLVLFDVVPFSNRHVSLLFYRIFVFSLHYFQCHTSHPHPHTLTFSTYGKVNLRYLRTNSAPSK